MASLERDGRRARAARSALTRTRGVTGDGLDRCTTFILMLRTARKDRFQVSLLSGSSSAIGPAEDPQENLKHVAKPGKRSMFQLQPTPSKTRAIASTTSSRQGFAAICTPIGNPLFEVPQRTTAAGHPVRL
jgi:hypothetical protein